MEEDSGFFLEGICPFTNSRFCHGSRCLSYEKFDFAAFHVWNGKVIQDDELVSIYIKFIRHIVDYGCKIFERVICRTVRDVEVSEDYDMYPNNLIHIGELMDLRKDKLCLEETRIKAGEIWIPGTEDLDTSIVHLALAPRLKKGEN